MKYIFLLFQNIINNLKNMKQKVLEYLQTIPKWKVTTYKNLAKIFEVHPRKIAMIMKYNKEPEKYPCYKVVASDWKISGYNTERWVPEKIEKLEKEGILIIDGKILEEFII